MEQGTQGLLHLGKGGDGQVNNLRRDFETGECLLSGGEWLTVMQFPSKPSHVKLLDLLISGP